MFDYTDVIAFEGARVSRVAQQGPIDASVPHIAGWTLSDVVAHLGGVHRWAERIVAERQHTGERSQPGTDTGAALIDWFDEGLDRLVTTLSAVDPAEEVGRSRSGRPVTAGYWQRRQAHETTMHRWDAETAAGEHEPIDAEFATDGIDELFRIFTRNRDKQVLDAPIRVFTTDTETSWILGPVSEPGRVDLMDEPAGAVASLEGPAETLLLALWKRISLDDADAEIGGRRATVREFVAGPISP